MKTIGNHDEKIFTGNIEDAAMEYRMSMPEQDA